MDEEIKKKDAEPASKQDTETNLEEGLEGSFPGSDPASATQPGGGEPETPAKPAKR